MLLQNITYLAANTLNQTGGTLAGELSILGKKPDNLACRFCCGIPKISSIPAGYGPGYAFAPPLNAGDMATFTSIQGESSFTGGVAGGLDAEATLIGLGEITNAACALIAGMVATLSGSGAFASDPAITGVLQLIATLSGSGDVTAALGALASLVATLTGTGGGSFTIEATGELSATIYVNEGTASQKSMAAEVWNSLSTSFNNPGTMGQKVNAAASAGDPWSTEVPGSYTGKQAGAQLLTPGKFLALK